MVVGQIIPHPINRPYTAYSTPRPSGNMIHGRHRGVSLNFRVKIPTARIPNIMQMLSDPPHHQLHHKPDLIIPKRLSFFNPMPFPQTSPAASLGRMLCNEYGMPFHRRLLAIIFRIRRRRR